MALFAQTYYRVHLCEGRVFTDVPRNPHVRIAIYLIWDAVATQAVTARISQPRAYAVCILGLALAWFSNWEEQLCLCTCYIPINVNGTACTGMHRTQHVKVQMSNSARLLNWDLPLCKYSCCVPIE